MTPEEIQELLKQAIGEIRAEILSEVDKKNAGLASSLTKEIKKISTPPVSQPEGDNEVTQERLSLKALQNQLLDLQTKLKEKDEQTFNAKRSEAVAKAISKSNVLNQSTLHKLFMLDNSTLLKEEGDNWFVEKNGQVTSLDEALKSYLNTDDGKLFIPSSGVNGSSSQETKPLASQTKQKVTAMDLMAQAF